MKRLVNYIAFLLMLLMGFMTIRHPENVRNWLGGKLSDSAQIEDKIVLAIMVIGTGYLAMRQGINDYRSRKNRKTTRAPNPTK